MLEILNRNKGTKEGIQKDSRFISFVKSIFSSSSNSQDLEEQQKLKYKIKMSVYSVIHVFFCLLQEIFKTFFRLLSSRSCDYNVF